MRKRILSITSILFVLFLIIAVVFFFLMKKHEPSVQPEDPNAQLNDPNTQLNDPAEYDVSQIVEKIEFLKLNTYDEIKKYADEYPIYVQESDDKTLFAIRELYIEDLSVKLFYRLNDDGSIKRFDGTYSYVLEEPSKDAVWNIASYVDRVIFEYFDVMYFEHDIYDENGASIDIYDENSYELMLDGKAKYNLSIVDESNTYWNISAVVTDKKQVEFEFFRCFDLSVYDDDSPNIDMRELEETGE